MLHAVVVSFPTVFPTFFTFYYAFSHTFCPQLRSRATLRAIFEFRLARHGNNAQTRSRSLYLARQFAATSVCFLPATATWQAAQTFQLLFSSRQEQMPPQPGTNCVAIETSTKSAAAATTITIATIATVTTLITIESCDHLSHTWGKLKW